MTDSADRSQRNALFKKLTDLPPPQLEQVLFILNPPSGNIPTAEAPAANRVAKLLEWAQSQQGCKLPAVEEAIEQALQTTGWNRQTEKFCSAQVIFKIAALTPSGLLDARGDLNRLQRLHQRYTKPRGAMARAEPLYLRVIEIGIKNAPSGTSQNCRQTKQLRGYGSRGSGGGAEVDQLSDHPTTQGVLRQLREE